MQLYRDMNLFHVLPLVHIWSAIARVMGPCWRSTKFKDNAKQVDKVCCGEPRSGNNVHCSFGITRKKWYPSVKNAKQPTIPDVSIRFDLLNVMVSSENNAPLTPLVTDMSKAIENKGRVAMVILLRIRDLS